MAVVIALRNLYFVSTQLSFEFYLDNYTNGDITNEKFVIAMLIIGAFLIYWGLLGKKMMTTMTMIMIVEDDHHHHQQANLICLRIKNIALEVLSSNNNNNNNISKNVYNMYLYFVTYKKILFSFK